jgi:hypothetical protein
VIVAGIEFALPFFPYLLSLDQSHRHICLRVSFCFPVFAFPSRTSAITPNNWRAHNVTVQSLKPPQQELEGKIGAVLSRVNIPTGLQSTPLRVYSPYTPRVSAFSFHPTEMLYGVGVPDGTSEWLYYLKHHTKSTPLVSSNLWL